MRTPRTTIVVSVGAGALIGALLGLRGPVGTRSPQTPSAEPPFRPVSRPAAPRATPELATQTQSAPTATAGSSPDPAPVIDGRAAAPEATAPPATDPDPAEIALAPSAELIRKDERACAHGKADRCVRAARFYEDGQGVKRDGQRALAYLRQAVKLYAVDCRERNARACYSLSRLYERGRGVPVDVPTARALIARAKEICQAEQSAFCDAPDAPDALRR